MGWILLAGIPQILLSGLVQEGAKLIPVVFWWLRNRTDVAPTMGLVVGAVAGAGLGIFEAVWAHNTVFASGFCCYCRLWPKSLVRLCELR